MISNSNQYDSNISYSNGNSRWIAIMSTYNSYLNNELYYCEKCKKKANKKYPFCPFCGRKMINGTWKGENYAY